MKSEISTIQQFVKSLGASQRRFFLRRETDIQARLQSGMRDLGRGLGEVAALNGEALAVVLETESESPAARRLKATAR